MICMDERKDFMDEEYDYPGKKRTNQRFGHNVRVNHGPSAGNDDDLSTDSVKGNEQGPLPRSIFLNDEK